jgi:hypothetical protein
MFLGADKRLDTNILMIRAATAKTMERTRVLFPLITLGKNGVQKYGKTADFV